jgi:hypothetical protein
LLFLFFLFLLLLLLVFFIFCLVLFILFFFFFLIFEQFFIVLIVLVLFLFLYNQMARYYVLWHDALQDVERSLLLVGGCRPRTCARRGVCTQRLPCDLCRVTHK